MQKQDKLLTTSRRRRCGLSLLFVEISFKRFRISDIRHKPKPLSHPTTTITTSSSFMGSCCCKGSAKASSLKRSSPSRSFQNHTSPENDNPTTIPFASEKDFYQPSTEETHPAYQALLSIIEHQVGIRSDQYQTCIAAEEILSVIKSVVANPVTQKSQVEKILNPIDQETFNQLVLIAGLITDYSPAAAPAEKGFYQPRSEDTWSAYTLFLKVMEDKIGSQQSLIDRCRDAHAMLLILKDKNIDVNLKMDGIENYLGTISRDTFQLLLHYAGLLWDFDDFKACQGEEVVMKDIDGLKGESGHHESFGYQDKPIGWSWDSLRREELVQNEDEDDDDDDQVSDEEMVDEHSIIGKQNSW